MKVSNIAIHIRNAIKTDQEEIIRLLNDVFKGQQRSSRLRDNDYFKWKFEASPFGKSILTVTELDNQIIAVDNLWPWELLKNNSTYRAFEACDSVVKKEFRGKGLLYQMRSFGIEQAKARGASFLFNFPNNQSLKTNLNIGYKYLGKVKWWVRIIDPIRTSYIMLKRNYPRNSNTCNLSFIDNLELLSSLHNKFHPKHLVTIKRNLEYFKYRFIDHPSNKYFTINIDDEIIAICTISNTYNINQMVVTEIIGNKLFINELINEISTVARKLNCAFITVISDNNILNKQLWLKGFILKKEKNMVVHPFNPNMEDLIDDFSKWNLTASLHDSI